MDAFEDLIARLLRNEGKWTSPGYRINLTKREKVAIGLPSMPRPEIDVLAYRAADNVLYWVECKSYLDSSGVRSTSFVPGDPAGRHYRVFTDTRFRRVASRALLKQAIAEGIAEQGVELRYCLVGGNFYRNSESELRPLFTRKGWLLYGPGWIVDGLRKLAERSYENDIVTLAVKLLERYPLDD